GALAGVGGWLALAPSMETVVGHRLDRFDLPWWGVGAAVGLAIITALAAAWWPARSLSRMSVMAALSGRPPRPRPARRFATLGCGLLAVTTAVHAAYQSATNGSIVTNLPANELVVYRSNPGEPLPDINANELHTAQQGVATIASGLGAQKTVELDAARDPAGEILQ